MTLKFPEELIINGDEWKIQPFRFNVHAINTGSYTPSYRDVTVTGVSPLNLPNAEANGLRNIKLYGKCEQAPNLFDKDKATLNYYINSSGEEQANASWACTDYIQVVEGGVYKLTGVTSYGNAPKTGFYAADKSFVSVRSQSSSNFTIPDGVKYMRVSIYKASIDTAVVKQVLSTDNPIPILCNNGKVGSTSYTVVGSPTISSDFIISNTNSSNYIELPSLSLGDNFTIITKFTTGNDLTNENMILASSGRYLVINYKNGNMQFVGGNGSNWNIGNFIGSTTLEINTTYYYKLTFDGTAYTGYISTDGTTWALDGTRTSTLTVPEYQIRVGASWNAGSNAAIDLKELLITIGDNIIRLPETVSLNNQTAVARDLLSCGEDYVDEQNITTGEITRKVGYKIFDGTENWNTYSGTSASGYAYRIVNDHLQENTYLPFCTHFNAVRGNLAVSSMKIGDFKCSSTDNSLILVSEQTTAETFKTWLAAQYSAGTPVIAVYPLATPTTETVAAQANLQTIAGNNTLTITQAAIDGLSMEVTYSAGVEVTIEAVQSANVDQTVEVTIGE